MISRESIQKECHVRQNKENSTTIHFFEIKYANGQIAVLFGMKEFLSIKNFILGMERLDKRKAQSISFAQNVIYMAHKTTNLCRLFASVSTTIIHSSLSLLKTIERGQPVKWLDFHQHVLGPGLEKKSNRSSTERSDLWENKERQRYSDGENPPYWEI